MPEPTNRPFSKFREDERVAPGDARLTFAAAERNADPICEALVAAFGGLKGHALEIGSGTGQHIVRFARALPALDWQGSDPDPVHCASIAAWIAHEGLDLPAPLELDATSQWADMPEIAARLPINLIFCANVIHISPFATAEGIFAGAGKVLAAGGALAFYGPFRLSGDWVAPSNETFDQRLRAQDERWGIRDADDLAPLAKNAGLGGPELVEMPANNRIAIWRKPA